MNLIVNEYISTDGNPDPVTSLMMAELDFLYKRNVTLFGYLNTAMEVLFQFVLGGDDMIPVSDLKELNVTRLKDKDVLRILEGALLIRVEGSNILPGILVDRLRSLRLEAVSVRSGEFQQAVMETTGVISVSLTKSLFDIYGTTNGRRFPRSAMAVLHLLASIVMEADDNGTAVDKEMALERFYRLMSKMLTVRQQRFALYQLVSFVDGRVRLLEDIDSDREVIIWGDVMVDFLERSRELIRELGRGR